MIDLHAHLLPGIDDGPPDIEGAVELARAAVRQGTRVLAATPHCREDHPGVRPAELGARAAEVRARLAADDVQLEVVQAGEVALSWALAAGDDELRRVSYGGRGTDLLVETPFAPLPDTFEMLLEMVVARGYRILLAHPENSSTFQQHPARLRELVARGVLLQVTGRSLVQRRKRSRAAALARALVADGLVHVLASDAHSAGAFRPPDLAPGVEAAAALVGEARARWMVEQAPAAVLAGTSLPDAPSPAAPPGSLLGRLRHGRMRDRFR